MFFYAIYHLLSLVVDMLTVRAKADSVKDLEIMVLRHQLRMLQCKVEGTPRCSRLEKLILAVLAMAFKARVRGLRHHLEMASRAGEAPVDIQARAWSWSVPNNS
jgi:hypothetical protein